MGKWKVKKEGRKYQVIRPDGTIRCSVEDLAFAKQICDENMREHGWFQNWNNRPKKGTSIKVRCKETGDVFETITDASRYLGIHDDDLRECMKNNTPCCGMYWERV